jgi:hypothetical protein
VAIIDLSTILKLLGKFGFEKNCVRAFDRKTQLGLANPSWVCDTKNVPLNTENKRIIGVLTGFEVESKLWRQKLLVGSWIFTKKIRFFPI